MALLKNCKKRPSRQLHNASGRCLPALRLGLAAIAGAGFFWPLVAFAAPQPTLKISTWNVEWLLDAKKHDAEHLPPDIPHRSAEDFTVLAAYATRLRPDLIGLQEVGDTTSLARLFPPQTYQLFLSNDAIPQHTAFAARRGLTIQRNPDVTALALNAGTTQHPLRSGLDITLQTDSASLRVLVVHLKTGCWDNPLSETHHACPTLFLQFQALQGWLGERAKNREAFAVIGDFNRRMTRTDPVFIALNRITPLDLVTAGHASPCLNGSYFIDHILLGGPAIAWKEPNSLRVMPLAQNSTNTLSDHCPVSITLRLPQKQAP